MAASASALVAAACAQAGPVVQPGGAVPPLASAQPGAELLYVCIQDEAKVGVIDMRRRAVVRIIDLTKLGFSPNAKPHHIVFEPDGSFWYVSLIGDNRVLKIDRDDRVVAQLRMETPGMLALHPSDDRLFISRSMSAVNPPPRIGVARRGDLRLEEIDVFFPRPHPIIATHTHAYTGSLGVNQLASVDLASETVELTTIEGTPHALVQYAISPDGRTLVASAELSGMLLVFDLAVPSKPALVRTVATGPMAFDPVFTPDGRFVYVPVKGANEVAIVETSGWTVVDRIRHPALRQPHQVVFAADGATAFVSNNAKADHMAGPGDHAAHAVGGDAPGAGSIVVIDVATRRAVQAIELGKNLTGIGTRARR